MQVPLLPFNIVQGPRSMKSTSGESNVARRRNHNTAGQFPSRVYRLTQGPPNTDRMHGDPPRLFPEDVTLTPP